MEKEEIKLLKQICDESRKTRRLMLFIYYQNYYEKHGVYPEITDALLDFMEELKKAGINSDTDNYDYQKGTR
jgi:hypothetical protein